jgi:hypothetical protein
LRPLATSGRLPERALPLGFGFLAGSTCVGNFPLLLPPSFSATRTR